MAYQITYDLSGYMKRISQWKRRLAYFSGMLLVIAVIIALLWTAGGDWSVTVSALEGMAEDLGQGSGLREAFSEFCLDVLRGAECG